MYYFCEHCDKLDRRQRKTKRFCSSRCRIAHNRGKVYEHPKTDDDKLIDVATAIADSNPRAYKLLEGLRDQHGKKALNIALFAIRDILKG